MINQFDIWLANLEPSQGTEPGKIRPVLIVQSNIINQLNHSSSIVCPLTTNLTDNIKILRIRISDKNSDIIKESDILIDQLRSIDNKRLIKYIGKAPIELHNRIKESLKIVLDLI